jgi:hypothetical protein
MMLPFRLSVFVCCLGMTVLPALAQADRSASALDESRTSRQSPEPDQKDRQAQGVQLQARRAALEKTYQEDIALCYQQFDVTGCRNVAREKRIEANAVLRKDELAYNARERRIASEEAQRRLDDKQLEAQRKTQEVALTDASLPRQSTRSTEVAVQQRNESSQRAAYEKKQREAIERRSNIEKRLRERDKPPAAPLPVPEAAK